MKTFLLIFLLLGYTTSFAQTKLDQRDLMKLLEGNWESSTKSHPWKIQGKKVGDIAFQLSIYEVKDQKRTLIATEMYAYDKWLNDILSFGTNNKSQAYKGRGRFVSANRLEIKNIDSHNTLFTNVSLTFNKDTMVMTILPSGAKDLISIDFNSKN